MNQPILTITLDDDEELLEEYPVSNSVGENETLEVCPPEYKNEFLEKYWKFEKKFTSNSLAVNFLETGKKWELNNQRCFATQGGFKATYRCKEEGARKCPVEKCLFYPIGKTEVLLFQTKTSHDHNPQKIIKKKRLPPLDRKVVARAEKLVEQQMKPTDIINQLVLEGFKFNLKQLQNKLYGVVKRYSKKNDWSVEQIFQCLSDTTEYLKKQKIWNIQSEQPTKYGVRYHYRCNLVPVMGPQCAAKMFFCYNPNSFHVVLYRRTLNHTHDTILSELEGKTSVDSVCVSDILMEHISEKDQTILKNNGFRIMYGVQLRDCALKKADTQNESQSIKVSSVSQTNETKNEETKSFHVIDSSAKYRIDFIDKETDAGNENKAVKINKKLPRLIKSGRKNVEWIYDRSFKKKYTAEEYIKSFQTWSKCSFSNSRFGFRQYYKCNLKKAPQCVAKVYLFYKKNKGQILLYRNHQKHVHPGITFNTYDQISKNQQPIEEEDLISDLPKNPEPKEQLNIIFKLPSTNICQKDTVIMVTNPFKVNKELVEGSDPEWVFVKKFKNPQTAKLYLNNISMYLVQSQKDSNTNLEYYACGSDPSNACLVAEYTNDMLDVALYKSNKTNYTHLYLVSNLEQSTAIVNWLQVESNISEADDDDKPFVANYTIDPEKQSFQCFVTTKRLLKMALDSCIIHADYNCTLNWRSYSIIILGTTDMEQKFHSFGVCITPSKTECDYEFAFRSLKKVISKCLYFDYKPNILVCNSVSTIQSAFHAVYGYTKVKVIICHEFMINEVSKNLPQLNKSIENEIIGDIRKIQKLYNPEIFLQAVTLFFRKWENERTFLQYFRTTWLFNNYNWYAGFVHHAPSTNTALVTEYNRIIAESKSGLFCSLSSLHSFMYSVVDSWSKTYINKTKAFVKKPTVSEALYDEACLWNSLQTNIDTQEIDPQTTYYYIQNENVQTADPSQLIKYKSKKYLSLDNLFEIESFFWQVKDKEGVVTCSCPYFFENYVCKHALGMASDLSCYSIPGEILGEDGLEVMNNEAILS